MALQDKNLKFEGYVYCNTCPFSKKIEIDQTSRRTIYHNWYCMKDTVPNSRRTIGTVIIANTMVNSPSWCPYKTTNQDRQTMSNNSYIERRDLWNTITPLIQWDDIKIGEVYHVPPVMGDERMDIVIISKNNYNVTYRRLDKDSTFTTAFYPGTVMSRFLVKHKIKDIKVINGTKK